MPHHFIIGRKAHRDKVHSLQKEWNRAERYTLAPSFSNTLRKGRYKEQCSFIDIAHFDGIIALSEGWVEVEPRLTMRRLVDALFPLIPPVVPEFPRITVGGAIMGAALESSSWKYGQFSDCCIEYELLLGNGEVVTASAEKNSDLFYGVSGSYGTLALLTAAKIRLIKAKKSVHIEVRSGDPFPLFRSPPKCDFLEAIRYTPKETKTLIASFSDAAPREKLRPYGRWFYARMRTESSCLLATRDYLFRFDRGAFWMGRYALSWRMWLHALGRTSPEKATLKAGDPPSWLRALLGPLCTSARLYRWLHTIPEQMRRRSFFIDDFYTPIDRVEAFLNKNRLYPIWLCPIKGTETEQFLSPHYRQGLRVNVGLYGAFQPSLDEAIAEIGGRKMLYGFCAYTRAEFENLYDEERYAALRKKFYAEKIFPHLYDKVR